MAGTGDFGRATNISSSAPIVELHQCLASHVAAISPFVEQLIRFIRLFMRRYGMPKNTEGEIEVALTEALANAVIHGNHENPEKNVDVICRCSLDGEVLIIVRDQGTGFESSAVPDPTEPERLFLTSGRGLHLMRALMDEVSFEENGTVVRMRKRVKTSRR
jgi:serine/threonine-protein kinase RsbW